MNKCSKCSAPLTTCGDCTNKKCDLWAFRASPCSRCVELEQKLAAIKNILADPVAVHINVLHGTIAKLSDANVKHVYPHLFENVKGGSQSPSQ